MRLAINLEGVWSKPRVVHRSFAAYEEDFEDEAVVQMSHEQGEELHLWLTAQLYGIKIQKAERP